MSALPESNPFTAEWSYTPRPSWGLLVFVGLLHGFTLLAVLLLPGLAMGWQVLLAGLILWSLRRAIRRHSGLFPAGAVKNLYWREWGGWELVTGDDEHLPVILCDSSFSSVLLTVLNFKTRKALGGRRFTVIVLPDNCSAAARRYLRMRLKLHQFVVCI